MGDDGRRRLLIIGPHRRASGLSRVARSLARRWASELRVFYFAVACERRQPFNDGAVRVLPKYAVGRYRYNGDVGRELADQLGVDLVLLAIDWVLMPREVERLRRGSPGFKCAVYCPFEGRLLTLPPPGALAVDALILYTENARHDLAACCTSPPRTSVIPLGVDTRRFRPLAESVEANLTPKARRQAKALAFPDRPELHDGFLVLNGNRHYPRKRIDLTVRAFARFCRHQPADAWLYLHFDAMTPGQAAALRQLIEEEGVEERVLINDRAPLGDEELNALYNACDVGINTAMGEGWGLVSFEHAAAGAPQIVPAHTSFLENWRDAAEMIELAGTEVDPWLPFEMYPVSVPAAADALERLYRDPELRRRRAYQAYDRARSPRFEWDAVAGAFAELFREICQ